MSMKIDEYLNSINALAQTVQNATASGNTGKTESKTSDGDSYIASTADASAVLPSENYNDILKVMQNVKAGASGSGTASGEDGNSTGAAGGSASAGESTAGAGGVSGGGNGGGSDSEEETTTKVVTINGVTYLETTTVTDGVTTVSRTVIGGGEEK
jgi:hypothetical protein